jgi:hypothetical protein
MNNNLSFWKKVGIVFGAIGAVLGVMISWQSIEVLPRWAWYSEVASVQEFAEQTRLLILGQEWERLDQQISSLESKPNLNSAERELLAKKRLRKSLVEQQLKELGRNQ